MQPHVSIDARDLPSITVQYPENRGRVPLSPRYLHPDVTC